MTSTPVFQLRLFGNPSIEGSEEGQPLTSRAAQRHRIALLALTALAPGQRLTRDRLLAYLWPRERPRTRPQSPQSRTYVLRSTLGESALLSEGDDPRLDAVVMHTDVAMELARRRARAAPRVGAEPEPHDRTQLAWTHPLRHGATGRDSGAKPPRLRAGSVRRCVSSNYGWQCCLARDIECAIAQQRRRVDWPSDFRHPSHAA